MTGTPTWRWVVAGVVAVHAVVHLLGVATGFGLVDVSELTEPVGVAAAVLWLAGAVSMLAVAVTVVVAPGRVWLVAVPAVVLSQVAIVTAWSDAWAGTLANLLVLAVALHDAAAYGPVGLPARYRRFVDEGLAAVGTGDAATAGDELRVEDLAALPAPVRRYVVMSGAVGRPRVRHVVAHWRGRIRARADAPWMTFTAVQHNLVGPPSRFFLMDARRGGLPVDVLHAYRGGTATMDGRLLSLVPIVHADGPEMDRSETVTVLNDMCILAPGALVDPRLSWEAVDDRTARVRFTVGSTTVGATLSFDEDDALVDFVSDDRSAIDADGGFDRQRWSTPLRGYRWFGPQRAWSRGEARWHPADGTDHAYLEAELVGVEANPTDAARRATGVPADAATLDAGVG